MSDEIAHYQNELNLIRKILCGEIRVWKMSDREISTQLTANGISYDTYQTLRSHNITQERVHYLESQILNTH